MRYSNEVKVGVAIVLTALVLFFGIRYLSGLPLFGSGYQLVAIFDDSEGLAPGNPVDVSGVQIGIVDRVRLLPGAAAAEVTMTITSDTALPRGTTARIGGFSALGDVSVSLRPGPLGAPPLTDGDTLRTQASSDLVGLVQNNAERIFGSIDTLITGAAGTFSNVDVLLADPESDLRATLANLNRASQAANRLLVSQQEQLAATLANLNRASLGIADLSGRANEFSEQNADSLALTIERLNRALLGVEAGLASFDATSAQLATLLARLNEGDGTLGLMLNDPTLYYNLNEAATNLNRLVVEFQADPKRYLQELRLVDIF